jgi:hypothetical protein
LSNAENRATQESYPQTTNTDANESDSEDDDADLLYTNESLLPQVDWDNLEKQLKQAQVERERYDKVGPLDSSQAAVVGSKTFLTCISVTHRWII